MPGNVVGVSNRPTTVGQRIAYALAQPLYANSKPGAELNIIQKSTERVGDVFALGSGALLLFRLASKLFRGDFVGDSPFENIKKWMPETLLTAVAVAFKILSANGSKLHNRKNQREDYIKNVIPVLLRRVGVRIGSLRDTDEDSIRRIMTGSNDKESVFPSTLKIGLLHNNELVDEMLATLFGMEIIQEEGEFYVQTLEDLMFTKDGNKYGLRIHVEDNYNFYDLLNTSDVELIAKSKNDPYAPLIPVQNIENTFAELIRNWLPVEMRQYFDIGFPEESPENLEVIRRNVEVLGHRVARSTHNLGGNIITVFDGGRAAESGNAGA